MIPGTVIAGLILASVLALLWSRYTRLKRDRYIREFLLPKGLYERLRKRRPELEMKDCMLVARGLRQFFLAHLHSGRKFVSMPSQVVDDLWHEFILFTKAYDAFCKQAFGRFLHHTPAVVLGAEQQNNEGLRRCWYWCCKEENIAPPNPSRLPLLFALDAKLGVADGFAYTPDCKALASREGGSTPYCGAELGSGSGAEDSSGANSSGDDGGGGGGCGGGD